MNAQKLIAGENKRYVERKDLSLGVSGRLGGSDLAFTIRNLSHTGFLAACSTDLSSGDTVEVTLPHVGTQQANVVWIGNDVYGFNFVEPITRAAVSAALLQGDPTHVVRPRIVDVANDRIWDMSDEVAESERLPLRSRMWLLIGMATLPWIAMALAASRL